MAVNVCNGDLAVCDTENHRVQIFDVQGNFIKAIGKKGKSKVKHLILNFNTEMNNNVD